MDIFLRVLFSADLWQATLQYAALLLLPALGGVLSERSGITNIAMEGMMLVGAYAAVAFSVISGNIWIGTLAAIICSGLYALIHAVASIHFHANQIVSGIALNLGATGITGYLLYVQSKGKGIELLADRLPRINLGFAVLDQNIVFYIAIVLMILLHLLLFKTNIGLRIRAVGEHPHAADTAGVNVRALRYWSVIGSGMLCGLAGAYLTLGVAGTFNPGITGGSGFIALAAMIFGRYTPFGAAGACLLFGFGQALGFRLTGNNGIGIPQEFVNALPYVLTLIALVGLVGKTRAPAADGVPYEPGKE